MQGLANPEGEPRGRQRGCSRGAQSNRGPMSCMGATLQMWGSSPFCQDSSGGIDGGDGIQINTGTCTGSLAMRVVHVGAPAPDSWWGAGLWDGGARSDCGQPCSPLLDSWVKLGTSYRVCLSVGIQCRGATARRPLHLHNLPICHVERQAW